MTLRELATSPADVCSPAASVHEAARRMAADEVGFLVVVDGERPVGVVTDRDIVVRALAAGHGPETPVAEVMTHHAVVVDEDATVEQAASLMADKQCRRLVLVDHGGHPLGVVSLDDLLRVAGDELHQVARAVLGTHHGHVSLP